MLLMLGTIAPYKMDTLLGTLLTYPWFQEPQELLTTWQSVTLQSAQAPLHVAWYPTDVSPNYPSNLLVSTLTS